MELGRPAEALQAYAAALGDTPRRFNGLAGAARAAAAAGDTAAATRYYAELQEQAAPGSPRPELREATAFVSRARREPESSP